MKGYVRMILVVTLLLLSTALLAALNLTGLWGAEQYSWQVSGKMGPSLITKPGGDMYFLSKDGALYELKTTGEQATLGQFTDVANVVAPAAYVHAKYKTVGSTDYYRDYIVYVTAQSTGNKVVVHDFTGTTPMATGATLTSSAYGVVVSPKTYDSTGTEISIYTATMDGKVYKNIFETTESSNTFVTAATGTAIVTVGGAVKIPPVLSKDKNTLYVLTQDGKFYNIPVSSFDTPAGKPAGVSKFDFDAEFTVPMAMDENGIIYALSTGGTIYKIDPSGNETHAKFLTGSDSSGVLIDGDGYVYTFGGGKVVVQNSNLVKLGEHTIGQKVTSTPAIVKGDDGKTYIIIPSSQDSYSGKITILSFNSTNGLLTKEWEYITQSSLPISAAVSVSPMGSLEADNYYFVTATNDGTVYGWQFNGSGPYGIWPMYGQNVKHSGFIDTDAMEFRTRIYINAYEGLSHRELSKAEMGNNDYGLLYDATIVNADGEYGTGHKNYHTNELDITKIPEGVAGSERLEVKFATDTGANLLLDTNKLSVIKGSLLPTKDATFGFARWDAGYEFSVEASPATIVFRFNDRTLNVLADATYTYYVYHSYPGDAGSEASRVDRGFKYNDYITNPSKAKTTIEASTVHGGKTWYPFKWNVYQWDPSKLGNYEKKTYGDKASVTLDLNGPAYIEIYYAQLSATITLLVPEFAYGRTPAYIFLDAATSSIAYTMEATMLNGVTIEKIVSEEYAKSLKKMQSSVTSDHVKYIFNGMETPLPTETRVATLAVNLLFPDKTDLSVKSDELFEQYFDLYGYAQLQGQLIDSQGLMARKIYDTNKYLYVLGNFDDDFDVDINDWNFFVEKYDTTVSGTEVIYNIGPREDFVPPYPNYVNYSAGFLVDNTNVINEEDLYVFASMFGFVVPDDKRLQ